MFTGVYERQLDERGRVALPPAFRSHIGEQCYLTFGEDSCVKVMSEATFREEAERIVAAVKSGEMSRSRQRAYSASVVMISPDKQGRIMIDAKLREYAGIDQPAPVVVLGVLDHLEVWAPEQYHAEESTGRDEIAGVTR